MVFLSCNPDQPASGMWDQYILTELFDQDNVIVIPGAYQAEYMDDINKELSKYPYCVVIISSDEEGKFPVEQLRHSNIKVYTQYNDRGDRQIPIGTPPTPPKKLNKTIKYAYMGQVNTQDRKQVVEIMKTLPDSYLLETEGFSQGLEREDYNTVLGSTRIIPCPGGHVSPDSFRLYEALEAGCTPVLHTHWRGYFESFLPGIPVPFVDDWGELKDIKYEDHREWWKAHKNIMKQHLMEDLEWLKAKS